MVHCGKLRGYIILIERILSSLYIVHSEKPEKFSDVNFIKSIIKDAFLFYYLELGKILNKKDIKAVKQRV